MELAVALRPFASPDIVHRIDAGDSGRVLVISGARAIRSAERSAGRLAKTGTETASLSVAMTAVDGGAAPVRRGKLGWLAALGVVVLAPALAVGARSWPITQHEPEPARAIEMTASGASAVALSVSVPASAPVSPSASISAPPSASAPASAVTPNPAPSPVTLKTAPAPRHPVSPRPRSSAAKKPRVDVLEERD
jgi:hypothetical protein